MNQAYSRLSTTHGHITDCKLDSVAYAGVRLDWSRIRPYTFCLLSVKCVVRPKSLYFQFESFDLSSNVMLRGSQCKC